MCSCCCYKLEGGNVAATGRFCDALAKLLTRLASCLLTRRRWANQKSGQNKTQLAENGGLPFEFLGFAKYCFPGLNMIRGILRLLKKFVHSTPDMRYAGPFHLLPVIHVGCSI